MAQLDFKAIKQIPIGKVCARYGITLRRSERGDYFNAKCPLHSHPSKAREKEYERPFSIKIAENFWRCFNTTCNEAAHAKGGDVINFVALMERCSQVKAAELLSDWYGVGKEKAASHGKRPVPTANTKRPICTVPPSDKTVKYMAQVTEWFDRIRVQGDQESDEDYRKRMLNEIKREMHSSYKFGVAKGYEQAKQELSLAGLLLASKQDDPVS